MNENPYLTLAKYMYAYSPPFSTTTPPNLPIRILCLSDTHDEQPRNLPPADILIHAGDLTVNGSLEELKRQVEWIKGLEGYKEKVVVGGNHDVCLDEEYRYKKVQENKNNNNDDTTTSQRPLGKRRVDLDWGDITYLNHSTTTLTIHGRTLHIYGSPLTPRYGNWAFQYLPSNTNPWTVIPQTTDVLVTHGPAKGVRFGA
ncbi:Metallophosphoesterase domain-containing [Pyrenophora seminiperda CCB06]|uniref:Metallophosphoesterase domain-containing n=1 Tax=Pyrenophora seminiperda CCB06 TaxID=1302712 RepID=A0A3M7MFW0_9PLEO|nr:Metallophosphoesterase domain-containing [Pyrenophora seminiperda CCB06]